MYPAHAECGIGGDRPADEWYSAQLARVSYNPGMASDEYHEALLSRVHEMQQEIRTLTNREAVSFAYLMSQDISEEGARMLVAELLLDYWSRTRGIGVAPGV
jgi:hypothetical protein